MNPLSNIVKQRPLVQAMFTLDVCLLFRKHIQFYRYDAENISLKNSDPYRLLDLLEFKISHHKSKHDTLQLVIYHDC